MDAFFISMNFYNIIKSNEGSDIVKGLGYRRKMRDHSPPGNISKPAISVYQVHAFYCIKFKTTSKTSPAPSSQMKIRFVASLGLTAHEAELRKHRSEDFGVTQSRRQTLDIPLPA